MKTLNCLLIPVALVLSGCCTSRVDTERQATFSAAQAAATENLVRLFAAAVARGVTERGPLAWHDYFLNSPAFMMAVSGHVLFKDGGAATRGIDEVTHVIAHIELRWGDDLRIDPLAPTLAMFSAPFSEVLEDPSGGKVTETGYFTGLVELGPQGWKFRNVHWSVGPPKPAVP